MTQSPTTGGFDPARSWWDMNASDRAEFLERMAQRLEQLHDPGGALVARRWVHQILENHQFPPLGREPREPLSGRHAVMRLHEVSRWTFSPGILMYPLSTILREASAYLAYVLDREQQRPDRGPER